MSIFSNFHKYMLRRYPRRIRNFLFVVDRHHQCNHKDCSMAYNMDKYKDLDNINSQISEQRNNSLRKLSNTLAFYKFDSYMKVLEIFFGLTNLKIKNVIASPSTKDAYSD